MAQKQHQELGGKSIIIRLEIGGDRMNFGLVANIVSSLGGDIIAIDTIHIGPDGSVRDMTVNVVDASGIQPILDAIGSLPGIRVANTSDRTFLLHLGGKIEMTPKATIQNRDDLSRVYTPDVARVCTAIRDNPDKAFTLTIKRNTVAVVSDGTAVLGLGNIGPRAAMPVMEGKAMLFKQFAGVDAFPICLDTEDTEEIASVIPDDKLSKHYIIPSVFDQSVVERIRDRVVRAAIATGAARRIPKVYR